MRMAVATVSGSSTRMAEHDRRGPAAWNPNIRGVSATRPARA